MPLPKKTEGAMAACPKCGATLVCRMTEYAGYSNYLQWQWENPHKAHYDSHGNCRPMDNYAPPAPDNPNTDDHQSNQKHMKEVQEQIKNLDKIPEVTGPKKALIDEETLLLLQIRKHVTKIVKEYEIAPHEGMIWQMTETIYHNYFTKNGSYRNG
jgi:hypothetical protein